MSKDIVIVTTRSDLEAIIGEKVDQHISRLLSYLAPLRKKEVYTITKAAELSGISWRKMQKLIKEGHIELTSDGRVSREAIEKYVDGQ